MIHHLLRNSKSKLKRIQKWEDGDISICPVCPKDRESCKHSHTDVNKTIFEVKVNNEVDKILRKKCV